jgi:hypothetical protein
MKRSLQALLAVVATFAGLLCYWLGKTMLETLVGNFFKGSLDQAGRPGWAVGFLVCGLALGIGGPPVMARDNRRRVAAGKKPRYGGVEFGVIMVAGIVFTLAGIGTLLGYW